MAKPNQIAGYAAALVREGVVPDRNIGPNGASKLAFILVQGFQNEHGGDLPKSPEEFVAWCDTPSASEHLKRHNQPGGWDWQPMGHPNGDGGNLDDWFNFTQWPDYTYGSNGEGAPRAGSSSGNPPAGRGADGSGGGGGPGQRGGGTDVGIVDRATAWLRAHQVESAAAAAAGAALLLATRK